MSYLKLRMGEAKIKNFLINSKLYFDLLNEQNLEKLKKLYHSNVELSDWNGSWTGIENVLDVNKGLFGSNLKFELESSNQIDNITYNHILIDTNKEKIKVLDVIYWNYDFKITKIEAFKG